MNKQRRNILKGVLVTGLFSIPLISKLDNASNNSLTIKSLGNDMYEVDGWVLTAKDLNKGASA